MAKCCVCSHRTERDTCKFFKFRKSPSKRKKWARCLKLENSPGRRVVCSCHFPNNDANKTPIPPHLSPKKSVISNSKVRRGLFSSTPSVEHGYSKQKSLATDFDDSGFDDMQTESTLEISDQQLNVTNQPSEQELVVADEHDEIVYSGRNKKSPWKVTPLKLQLQAEQNNCKLVIQQLEDAMKLQNKTEEMFRNAENDFQLKLKQSEENLQLQVIESEMCKKKLETAQIDFQLKLKEVEETLQQTKESEDKCRKKLEIAMIDFQLKLKQAEDRMRLQMQKSIDDLKVELNSLSSEKEELQNKLELQSKDLDLFLKVSSALKNEKKEYKMKVKAAEERHLFKNFITEDNISHYTGLPTLGTFYWLLSMVQQGIHYYFGSSVNCLSKEDQLFITLFKLRRNVTHQLLADLFNVSLYTVSNIVITWISVLHIILVEGIMNKNVPSLQKVRRSMPEAFSMYPNCRMIFDCTEVEVEIPSLMSNHNQVYSSYKSRTTFKALVVIAPNGTIIYVSDLFPGSTSDKVVVYNCGVLDLLKAGDAVMADKGFPIGDILPPGVDLNLPPFKETPQFTRGQIFETLQIARSRIHVERAILRVKYFHILDKIPHSLFQFSSKVFQVCAGLTNLRFSLIKEVENDMKL